MTAPGPTLPARWRDAAATHDDRRAWRRLVDAAAARYRIAGRAAAAFARGKLAHDPVFAHVVRHGLVEPQARVLDVGCGRGLLASALLAAQQLAHDGAWPRTWAPAPIGARVTGIDLMARDVALARAALRGQASFVCGDLRATAFPASDVVVLLDVLHYVDAAAQDDVLARARTALAAGGTLVLRVGDASRPIAFAWSRIVDTLVVAARGGGWMRLHGRAPGEWIERLGSLGFESVEAVALPRAGLANVLLIARVPRANAA